MPGERLGTRPGIAYPWLERKLPMSRIQSSTYLLSLLLLASSVFSLEVEGFAPDKEVVYKTVDDVQLKLGLFLPPDFSPEDQRPAVVFFFGGGWKGGSPTQFYPHCKYLAGRGMVALAADYRVFSRHKTSPRECVKDGKSAIRWIRQHAGELGVNPDRIAAGGGSAGGHIAAATGTTAAFSEENEDQTISTVPNALILFNPVLDTGPDGYAYEKVRDFWRELSPMHNISAKTPPAIIFLGDEDAIVPVSSAEKFKQLMAEKGIRCDLEVYPGQKHGFFNYPNRNYFADTVRKMDLFLVSLGWLEGEPALESTGETTTDVVQ